MFSCTYISVCCIPGPNRCIDEGGTPPGSQKVIINQERYDMFNKYRGYKIMSHVKQVWGV